MPRPRPEDAIATTAPSLAPDATSPPAPQRSLAVNASRFTRRSNAQEDTQRRVHRQSLRPTKENHEEVAARPRVHNPKRHSPKGGSWGRAGHGRQFTVGNIGNNGRIYLRPVIRPGYQRTNAQPSQPPFLFPPDAPYDSGDADTKRQRPLSSIGHESFFSSTFTPPRAPKSRKPQELHKPEVISPPKASTHVRAHSFSTIADHEPRPIVDQSGTFKVVIHRPRRHSGEIPPLPVIEVPIPNYRLGTPQFGTAGTALMRSSSYTRDSSKEEPLASDSNIGKLLTTPSALRSSYLNRRHSDAFPRPLFDRKSTTDMVGLRASLQPSQSGGIQTIESAAASLYDHLTLNPDDPSVVRYAPNSAQILAATPSRLIAHITSPSFLDYELLSDFFLTFRAFVRPDDLVSFLISRLRWAVSRVDDFGRIVRVRTFVALRHWILNYFVDDFMPDEDLRAHFCNLVNALYEFLQSRSDGGGGDIKIVGELKKCWRRTCALHWPNADPFARESPEDDILPGGQPASSHSTEDSTQTIPLPVPKPAKVPIDGPAIVSHSAKPSTLIRPDTSKGIQHAPHPSTISTPQSYGRSGTATERGVPLSPSSEQSSHVLSCSIPYKPIYRSDRGAEIPLFPHPVPAPMLTITSSPTTSKPPHPLQAHLRIGSFYDPLPTSPRPLSLLQSESDGFDIPAMFVVPGSLVRGVLYQPDSPYFDIRTLGSLRMNKIETPDVSASNAGRYPSQTNPGVKKLFGSVRRALGSKQSAREAGPSGSQSIAPSSASPGNLLSPTTPIPERPANAQQPRKSAQRSRTQVRVDLLAAKVGDSFKEAIEAGMEEDRAIERDILAFTKHAGSPADDATPRTRDPRFDRSVTVGSRSIVIVDDTNPDLPLMSGAQHPPSNPASRDTMSLYEDYVANATRSFRSQRDQKLVGHTSMPIESVILGQVMPSPSTDAGPAVYIPTGFQKGSKGKEPAFVPPRVSSRQRFSNSLRSSMSATRSLRKYASYHSGDSKSRCRREHSALARNSADGKSTDGEHFVLGKPPPRQLRRRPGGDLKAATKVHDLEQPLRPRSAGSVSSLKYDVDSVTLATKPLSEVNQAGTPATTPKKRNGRREGDDGTERRSISLIQTHSSQPNLRPSFEAEVAKLAALPDDDDDGGIAAALLKLEGRYEKKTPVPSPALESTQTPIVSPIKSEFGAEGDWRVDEDQHDRKIRHHKEHVEDVYVHPEPVSPVSPGMQTRSIYRISRSSDVTVPSHLLASPRSLVESEESYSSIPLLERSHSGPLGTRLRRLDRLILPGSNLEISTEHKGNQEQPESANSSIEHVTETDSMRRIPRGETMPRSPTMHKSFLLDDTQEDISEVSEGLHDEPSETESPGVKSFFDDEAVEDDRQGNAAFSHPLRHPDTPPVVYQPRKKTPPVVNQTTFNQGLPTPGLTPTATAKLRFKSDSPISPVHNGPEHKHANPPESAHSAPHLPFILAFDPEILAQQFTIIEKDALDEIDWKELIDLRWKQSSPSVTDWVAYLRTQDPRGVDLVITRFNLVVKWAVSEVVLTEIQDERVKCIVQYIRIASHCRRLRNYATMYQITIALLSAECSRLKRTWDNVPAADQQTFKELESLVQPIRNFHNLRVEMETGMGDDGCIPFIGIYTRDLVYNAQKPPFISSPPLNSNEPLVNFERHHTAANIVKSLLRLLEASSKYQFTVEPLIISKCLWMATLTDDDISSRSKRLE